MCKQLIVFGVGLLALLATSLRVDAHAFLVRAEPRVGSRINRAPNEIRISLSEPVQPGLSSIKVFNANGKQVDRNNTHFDRDNRALLVVSLRPQLSSGTYRVAWRVTSVDTHVTSGGFKFQVGP